MGDYDGAIAAVLIVIAIAALIFWLWLAWVGVGMLMVYLAMPSEFLLHLFLWFCVLFITGKMA